MRTFIFKPDDRKPLNIDEMLILPEAQKVIFYGQEHFGEISLKDYPFESTHKPDIKIYKVHSLKEP